MAESSVDVSVVLPAFNEAQSLPSTVEATLEALARLALPGGYEVVIAEDGCTDDTPAVAEDLAVEHTNVHHLHSPDRLGRGRALARAVDTTSGDVIVYYDTDLATDLTHLGPLIDAIRSGEYDIATGSRLLPASQAERPIGRDIPSRVYNGLVRGLLRSRVRDHQCGFKAFDRAALEALLPSVEAEHWFWDTEILVRAQRAGYHVEELPVRWTQGADSTVDVPRDALNMGTQLLALWWRLRAKPLLWRGRGPLALLITVILGYIVLSTVADPGEIVDQIAAVDTRMLAIAAGLYVFSWPIRGVRYRDILRELGYSDRVGFLTGAIFISQTGNLLLPARAGDAIRAYIVKARRAVPYPTGFASLAVERIFDILTITALAGGVLVGVLTLFGSGALAEMVVDPALGDGGLVVAAAIGVAIVALIGFGAILVSARIDDRRFRRWVPNQSTRLGQTVELLISFVRDIRVVSTRPGAVVRIGATSLLVWMIEVFTAVLVLVAFGVDLGLGALIVVGCFAMSVGNLAKIVPISPGGIGPYEAGFSITLVALAPIGIATAVAVAIVDHALKNVITGVGGVLATGVLNVSLVTAVREGSASRSAAELSGRHQ